MNDRYTQKAEQIYPALEREGRPEARRELIADALRESAATAFEQVRASLAAEATNAGETTGFCETCAGFDMTGWSMDTINGALDKLKGSLVKTLEEQPNGPKKNP